MIGFKALRAVIAELHGEGASAGALLARFKYFQRMGFPGGSNVGRGSRADYALGDVLALAMAFELLETSVTPVRVVRLLRSEWPAIERAIVSTWASLEGRGGRALLLANAPGALGDLGRAEDDTVPASYPLTVVGRDEVLKWLDAKGGAGSPAAYLIDLSRFVQQAGVDAHRGRRDRWRPTEGGVRATRRAGVRERGDRRLACRSRGARRGQGQISRRGVAS